ncbi:hypothetical protein C4577_03550 [Candidatus Parcubacteria bacterium]|nr:MAG: hypothetical protein C4577_03550 [Candidatus Parcubacteria bacterium]
MRKFVYGLIAAAALFIAAPKAQASNVFFVTDSFTPVTVVSTNFGTTTFFTPNNRVFVRGFNPFVRVNNVVVVQNRGFFRDRVVVRGFRGRVVVNNVFVR